MASKFDEELFFGNSKLDNGCWKCSIFSTYQDGFGNAYFVGSAKDECDMCNGKRFVPTELGSAILEFVERNKR